MENGPFCYKLTEISKTDFTSSFLYGDFEPYVVKRHS